jgi:hypothetical protein
VDLNCPVAEGDEEDGLSELNETLPFDLEEQVADVNILKLEEHVHTGKINNITSCLFMILSLILVLTCLVQCTVSIDTFFMHDGEQII